MSDSTYPSHTLTAQQALTQALEFVKTHQTAVLEVLGPTASGKTGFSIQMAEYLEKQLNRKSEVLSVDSRQVYKDIDVSSAKITAQEMADIPHHGIDLLTPEETFSAYEFQQYGFQTIQEILERKHVPILCGGTMLWLDAISENYIFTDQKGEKSTQKGTPLWPVLKIGLWWDRQKLYERIDQRAAKQFEQGMIEETKSIMNKYSVHKNPFTSFGYQEIKEHLEGKLSLEEALKANQKRNRNYAKRQLTWWRGRKDILWIQMP